MVEIFIPPMSGPGVIPIRVEHEDDAKALLSMFALDVSCPHDWGEVIMLALGAAGQLLAVVTFGDVALEHIVSDPRPLVALAGGTGCRSVMLAQLGPNRLDAAGSVEARRVIGSALEIDEIRLSGWLEFEEDRFRSCR